MSFAAAPFGLGMYTVRAIALKPEFNDSEPASATFIVAEPGDVDADDNGLIEISNLEMLNNIRYNLEGTSYDDELDDGSGNEGSSSGAPASRPPNCVGRSTRTNLCGYELTQDLDFASAGSYASGVLRNEWRPDNADPDMAANAGFPGFGPESGISGGFTAIFDGRGHTISNLYSRSATEEVTHIGLFNFLGEGAVIRNIGVTEGNVYGDATRGNENIGALVGYNLGTIEDSHSSADPHGGGGRDNNIGGLVGFNRGIIERSYATGNPQGGDGIADNVGGLVGYNGSRIDGSNAIVRGSYATGDPNGGGGREETMSAAWWQITGAQLLPAMPPATLMLETKSVTTSAAWWGTTTA